ncbi:hypothetical protein CTAYLR_008999 [Chrysophaeum taylorii]|uniref:t-SNARE coiled-coil homology domain-containing protein n=1 Tax=Chrysophaeum taylorii TaxID=2483200 RepID=A0AAD7UMW2_9STRA|nr:hypothetical protein CTAYLR_008999 [Chrysophaeum taylorii]
MASRDLTRKFVERRSVRPRAPRPPKTTIREQQPLSRFSAGVLTTASSLTVRRRSGGYHSDASDVEAGTSSQAPALPPVWVDLVDAVESDVAKIEKATRELQALHTKRLMVSFDDANEEALDAEIDSKMREATRLFRVCESTLKRVASREDDDLSDSERTIRANIQRSVAMRIQNLNADFRKTQKEYLQRLKRQKEGTADATFDFLSGGGASDQRLPPDDDGFNDQQLAAVVDVENLVAERDDEIRKIAESIQELSTIFKELAVLVIDQGTILDRIDFNMEQVAEHTRKGVVEIERAEQYQKAARPRICILVLMLLNGILVIFLVLKYQNKDKKKK